MSSTVLRRICLVGVRGVGKTTLIRSILHALPGIDHVVGSAVLRELAGPAFARFDHLPADAKQRYREDAISWMEERQRSEGKHILCDGHTALLDESTGAVGAVFTARDCAFFRELVLLEAPGEVVLAHRRADPSKRRSLVPEIVAAELSGERETCRRIAEQWGMRIFHLPPSTDPATPTRLLEILS